MNLQNLEVSIPKLFAVKAKCDSMKDSVARFSEDDFSRKNFSSVPHHSIFHLFLSFLKLT
jgi:hypothetical protein